MAWGEPKRPLTMFDIQDKLPEYQEIFAKHIARGIEPFTAALHIFKRDNTALAYQASQEWPCDANVQRIVDAYKGEKINGIPTKDQLAKKIYDESSNHFVFEEKIKGYKLVADLMGYIEKGAAVVNNNVVDNRRVMIVKDHGTPEEWEAKVTAQQRKLIDVSASSSSERTLETD